MSDFSRNQVVLMKNLMNHTIYTSFKIGRLWIEREMRLADCSDVTKRANNIKNYLTTLEPALREKGCRVAVKIQ